MIRLRSDEFRALARYADVRRRHPREVVELVVRAWLARRGYLNDFTNAPREAAQSNTRARAELGNLARERAE